MSLARNVSTVGSATLLSRLLGFARDMGIAALLGAGVTSDAFFAALQLPNLFRRLLAEGALNAGFVPLWTRIKAGEGAPAARQFGRDVLGFMLLTLGLISLACIVFAPGLVRLVAPGFGPGELRTGLAADYIRLAAPYLAAVGVAAAGVAILNAEGRVGAAALGPVVFNGVVLAALAGLMIGGDRIPVSAGAVLAGAVTLGGLAQLLLVASALRKLAIPSLRPTFHLSPQVRRFLTLALPGVIAGGIPQIKLMAGIMIASSSDSAVSWLYYAYRLYELPLGVVSIAIASVMVPLLAASVRSGAPAAFAAAQSRACEIGLGLALPAAAAFAVLAQPIIAGLFQRGAFDADDTAAVAAILAGICAGLPGHALEKVLGAVSFVHADTRTPMLAALTGLAVMIAGALILFPPYGPVGIAVAIALSGWVGVTAMTLVLAGRGWLQLDDDARRRLPRIILATVIMAAVLWLLLDGADHLVAASSTIIRLTLLAALVAAGLAAYLAALHLLRVADIPSLVNAIRKRA